MPFAEAAPMLRKQLERNRLAELEKSWYDGLEAQYPIEYLNPQLRQEGKQAVP